MKRALKAKIEMARFLQVSSFATSLLVYSLAFACANLLFFPFSRFFGISAWFVWLYPPASLSSLSLSVLCVFVCMLVCVCECE